MAWEVGERGSVCPPPSFPCSSFSFHYKIRARNPQATLFFKHSPPRGRGLLRGGSASRSPGLVESLADRGSGGVRGARAGERTPGGRADRRGEGKDALASPPTRLPRCRRTVPEALPPRAVMWNPLHETDSASVAWLPSAPALRGGPGAGRRPLRPRLPLRYEGEDGVRAMLRPPGSGSPCRGGSCCWAPGRGSGWGARRPAPAS